METQTKDFFKITGEILLNCLVIGALVFLIRSFLIAPFQVFGPSMCDTFNNFNGTCRHTYGEYLIVNKFGYLVGNPQRGDIIVFRPPTNLNEFFIKRVIGLPGETVKLQDGDVYIFNSSNPDGFKLEESYLNAKNRDNTMPIGGVSNFTVPKDSYFVMGDNRGESSDSRSCFEENLSQKTCGKGDTTPFLPDKNIEGRAEFVLWPLKALRVIPRTTYGES